MGNSKTKKLLHREFLNRYGETSLRGIAATTLGGYAIFGGGGAGSYKEDGETRLGERTYLQIYSYSNDVFVFEKDGKIVSSSGRLSVPRRKLAATSIGDYAIFAGGSYRSGFNWIDNETRQNPYSKVIDVFKLENGAVVRHDSKIELTLESKYVSAVTLGDYAIFASWDDAKSSVDVFRNGADGPEKYEFEISADKLDYIMDYDTKGLVVGKYAIFASGGRKEALTFTVGNNKELELTPHGDNIILPEDSTLCGAASVGNYAIFITRRHGGEYDYVNELTVYELVNDQFVKKETKFNIYSSYSGIQSASSKNSAVFFGNNTNIYYIFTINAVGELEMNEHKTDIVISQTAGTFVDDKLICLEGKINGYVVSTYDF